ncbi:MAG: DUF6340 family protein [Paludibacteraceae bacterium]
MRSKSIFPFLLFACVLLMTSCASKMCFTTLDILKPAEVSFPLNVNNVVIVNNAVPQPSNFGHYTTSIAGNVTNESLPFDSAAIFVTAGLCDALKTKSFFNQIELSLVNQNTSGNFNYANRLSADRIKTLCKMFNADAVISVGQDSNFR